MRAGECTGTTYLGACLLHREFTLATPPEVEALPRIARRVNELLLLDGLGAGAGAAVVDTSSGEAQPLARPVLRLV